MGKRKSSIPETFDKLKGRMKEMRYNQEQMAKELGISAASLNKKLNSVNAWHWNEIKTVIEVLDIPIDHLCEYFFPSMLRNRKHPKDI